MFCLHPQNPHPCQFRSPLTGAAGAIRRRASGTVPSQSRSRFWGGRLLGWPGQERVNIAGLADGGVTPRRGPATHLHMSTTSDQEQGLLGSASSGSNKPMLSFPDTEHHLGLLLLLLTSHHHHRFSRPARYSSPSPATSSPPCNLDVSWIPRYLVATATQRSNLETNSHIPEDPPKTSPAAQNTRHHASHREGRPRQLYGASQLQAFQIFGPFPVFLIRREPRPSTHVSPLFDWMITSPLCTQEVEDHVCPVPQAK